MLRALPALCPVVLVPTDLCFPAYNLLAGSTDGRRLLLLLIMASQCEALEANIRVSFETLNSYRHDLHALFTRTLLREGGC